MLSFEGFLLLHLIMENNFTPFSVVSGQLIWDWTFRNYNWIYKLERVWDATWRDPVRWMSTKVGFQDWEPTFQHTQGAPLLMQIQPLPRKTQKLYSGCTLDNSSLWTTWACQALIPSSSKSSPPQKRPSPDGTPHQVFLLKAPQVWSSVLMPCRICFLHLCYPCVIIWLFSPLAMSGRKQTWQKRAQNLKADVLDSVSNSSPIICLL